MSTTRLPALRPVAAVLLVATLSGCAMMGRMSDRMSARMDSMSPSTASSASAATGAGSMSADESMCATLRTAAGEGRPPASSPVIVAGEHHLGGGMPMARGGTMRMAGAGRVDRDSTGLSGSTSGSATAGAASGGGTMSSGATGAGAGAGGSMTGAVGRGSDAVARRDGGSMGMHGGAMAGAGGNPLAWGHHMGGLHGPNSQPLARNQPTPEMRCGVDRSEVYVHP